MQAVGITAVPTALTSASWSTCALVRGLMMPLTRPQRHSWLRWNPHGPGSGVRGRRPGQTFPAVVPEAAVRVRNPGEAFFAAIQRARPRDGGLRLSVVDACDQEVPGDRRGAPPRSERRRSNEPGGLRGGRRGLRILAVEAFRLASSVAGRGGRPGSGSSRACKRWNQEARRGRRRHRRTRPAPATAAGSDAGAG